MVIIRSKEKEKMSKMINCGETKCNGGVLYIFTGYNQHFLLAFYEAEKDKMIAISCGTYKEVKDDQDDVLRCGYDTVQYNSELCKNCKDKVRSVEVEHRLYKKNERT